MNDEEPIKPAARRSPIRRGPAWAGRVMVAGSLSCWLLFSAAAAEPFANADCLNCHTDPSTGRVVNGKFVPLGIFSTNSFTKSVHGKLACVDCHTGIQGPIHERHLPPPRCAGCHEKVAKEYATSIHGVSHLPGASGAANCWDCHGAHDIKRAVDGDSPINHANVAKTCGKCHLDVEKTCDQSRHGRLNAKGDLRAPVCTDCHTAHAITNPQGNNFKAISDRRCGKCHEDRLAHYRDTYHGKAMALGRPNAAPAVAACYDCHGYHDVLPPSDPRSHLSHRNILATCQKCHPGATAGFTEYKPHANPLDGRNYPLLHAVFLGMTGLLIGVFAFFGCHTVLWLARLVYLYLRDPKKVRESKIQTQEDGEWFTRFVPFERFLHFLVVSSFLLLVITGMPLKFYYTGWAKALFSVIGGPETARILHRFGAIITFFYFGLHLTALMKKAWNGRGALRDPAGGKFKLRRLWRVLFGPDSLMPTVQDWRDFVAHNKWFFGKGPRPQFDRWTYWEKFDYFAVFWGVAIIGASGLVLWFPTFFTRFLPGWIINVALLIHSDEALLAAGFIFSVHFFNTHFRIEKFPMDTAIFSGRISQNEMLHDRKRWYDRLVAEGRLDQHRVKDEWEQWKNIARAFGYFFLGLGIILLLLIIYAMAVRLTP